MIINPGGGGGHSPQGVSFQPYGVVDVFLKKGCVFFILIALCHTIATTSRRSRSRQPSATISNQFPTKILVLNRSPTVCRPVAEWSTTNCQLLATDYRTYFTFWKWSATIWRVIADWSPTVWRDVICIIFWITLPSKEIPTWNFFWNEGDTIDYVNQLQQPVADQSPTNLELLFL